MAKKANQKLKLLYLADIFRRYSDEEQGLTLSQLIAKLNEHGIAVERKTLYADIDLLREYGMDIELRRGKTSEYYLANRDWQKPEIMLLADAVASSRFITTKKSNELIKKLGSLTSMFDGLELNRQIIVADRIKSENEKIYYNIDSIQRAITKKCQITFTYFEYNRYRRRVAKRGGELYKASPYAMVWDNENYYMVAYYHRYKRVVNFRVDRMESISVTDEPIVAMSDDFNLLRYKKKLFTMYGGEECQVTLRFSAHLLEVFLDRFGKDASIVIGEGLDKGWFFLNCEVSLSPAFYGWIMQFCDDVRIISPKHAVEELCSMADRITRCYMSNS